MVHTHARFGKCSLPRFTVFHALPFSTDCIIKMTKDNKYKINFLYKFWSAKFTAMFSNTIYRMSANSIYRMADRCRYGYVCQCVCRMQWRLLRRQTTIFGLLWCYRHCQKRISEIVPYMFIVLIGCQMTEMNVITADNENNCVLLRFWSKYTK